MIELSSAKLNILNRFLSFAALKSFEGKEMPEWIKNHPAFEAIEDVQKVYPKIGLSNFKEPVGKELNIENIGGKNNFYTFNLIELIISNLTDYLNNIYDIYSSIEEDGKANNEQRQNVKNIYFLTDNLLNYLNSNSKSIPKIDETGKTIITLDEDIKNYNDKSTFRKGQGLLRVYAGLRELINKEPSLPKLAALEGSNELKEFNKYNIPLTGNNYEIVFTSTDSGSWDLATMGERGIRSCQSWSGKDTEDNNPCLIGSILSKYVGIIYLTNGKDFSGKGGRMLKRCIVRLGVDLETKSPIIILDKMYDAYDDAIAKMFIDALQKRTKLPVLNFSNKTYKNIEQEKKELEKYRILEDELPEGVKGPYIDSRIKSQKDKDLKNELEKHFQFT